MPLPLIFAGLFFLVLVVALLRRIDFPEALRLALTVASALALASFPVLWALVSMEQRGGPLEENLYPGTDMTSIKIAMLIGAVFIPFWALRELWTHLATGRSRDRSSPE